MGSLSDVILKSETILKKYEKYDPMGLRVKRPKSDDPFMDLYFEIMDRVQDLNLRVEQMAQERNRAKRAQLSADVRAEKKALFDYDLPGLARLVNPKKSKTTPEQIADRTERFEEVKKAIEEVPDGLRTGSSSPTKNRSFSSPSYVGAVVLNPDNLTSTTSPGMYQHTAETSEFQREYAANKDRQDVHLDNIERGLSTLKDIGSAMQDELERQDVVIDDVSRKMDTVTAEISDNNKRLKGLVTSVRKSRNFFIDLILICILLAIGLYLYNMLS